MIALLRAHSNFRRFWLGQVISQVGDRVQSLALLWLAYHWTGSGLAVGAVMIATTLPGVLLGPIAGEYADRLNRRLVLIYADLFRSAIVFWLAWRALTGALDLPEMLVATALMAMGAAFFNPASMAMMPMMVPSDELTRANAMNQLSANTSGVLGPLVGSGLIAAIGVPLAFVVNACSYLGSAAFEASLVVPRAVPRATHGIRTDLIEGWRAAARVPLVLRMLGPTLVVNFFFSSVVVLVPVLAEKIYHAGAPGLGLLMSSYALGMLAGAVGLSAIAARARRGWQVIGGMLGMGAAFLVMSVGLWLPLTCLGLALLGLGLNAVNINLISLYQQIVPNELLGKVFGLITALGFSSQPIAYGVMGALVDTVSPRIILLASGAVICATTLTLVRLPELRAI